MYKIRRIFLSYCSTLTDQPSRSVRDTNRNELQKTRLDGDMSHRSTEMWSSCSIYFHTCTTTSRHFFSLKYMQNWQRIDAPKAQVSTHRNTSSKSSLAILSDLLLRYVLRSVTDWSYCPKCKPPFSSPYALLRMLSLADPVRGNYTWLTERKYDKLGLESGYLHLDPSSSPALLSESCLWLRLYIIAKVSWTETHKP